MKPLYEGKAKSLWATDDPHVLCMGFKNDATAFNGENKAQFEDEDRFCRDLGGVMDACREVLARIERVTAG